MTTRPFRSAFQSFLASAFGDPIAAILSLGAGALMLWIGSAALDWLILQAVWPWEDPALCAERAGACWPFFLEKTRLILFGVFPYDEQWRPAIVSLCLCGLSVLVGLQMIGRGPRLGWLGSVGLWMTGVVLCFVLMGGGVLGLSAVPSVRWSGLPVLLILSVVAIAFAFPLGVLLALARAQNSHPMIRRLAAAYVEVARGVPMVTVLFVGVFVLPLTLPPGSYIAPVPAALITLIFFHAAYFAEDVRAGLLGLPHGQWEAARALGLGYWRTQARVLLPQAVHRSLPALMNSIIGAYKDTSLVLILGIYDLTKTAQMSFSDPAWRAYALEAYVFVGVWFFISCAFLSAIGRRLHKQADADARRD